MLGALAMGLCPAALQMGQPSLVPVKHDFPEGANSGEREREVD